MFKRKEFGKVFRKYGSYYHNNFNNTKNISFESFEEIQNGRLVTQYLVKYPWLIYQYQVVYCRNPYGTHNLILICDGQAIAYGYKQVITEMLDLYYAGLCPKKALSKAFKYKSSVRGSVNLPWYSKGFGDEVHNFVL